MQAFEYAHPATVKEALGLLGPGWNDAAILAGGTDLISAMKDDVETPRRVVNIKGVAGLEGIRTTATGTTIGALATIEHLLGDAALMKAFPSLAQAAHGISSPQMRHGHHRRRPLPASALLVFPRGVRPAGDGQRQIARPRRG